MPHKNRQRRLGYYRDYYRKNIEKEKTKQLAYYWGNREKIAVKLAQRRRAIKLAIFAKYGNKCVRCSFSDWRAFQIDHVNGGGKKENARSHNSIGFLRRVLQDSTNHYQLLCANCNWIKSYEKKERRDWL